MKIKNRRYTTNKEALWQLREEWDKELEQHLNPTTGTPETFLEFLMRIFEMQERSVLNWFSLNSSAKNCNGLPLKKIKILASQLGIDYMTLLKPENNEEQDRKDDYNMDMTITENVEKKKLSELSKQKIYDLYSKIDWCITEFFVFFEIEDTFFDILDSLRVDAIVIPEHLYSEFEEFTYTELGELYEDPESILEEIEGIQGVEKRNQALMALEDQYRSKLAPIAAAVKEQIMYR